MGTALSFPGVTPGSGTGGTAPAQWMAYRNGYDRIRWGTPDTNDTGRTDSSPAQSLSDASAVMDAPNHSPAQA